MEAIKINDYKNHTILDFDVIKKVIAGEKGLYEILMRRHNQKLYRVIRSYINDEDEIKDIMQNTYLKAYENLYQFNQKSEFSTWLIRIGINESLQEIKSKKRHVLKNSDSLLNKRIINISNNNVTNPEKEIMQKEAKYILEKAIDELPSKYKTIYILREIEEMKIKDISDCLDLSESNVKVRIHRSKQLLKDKLYKFSLRPNVFEFGFSKCDALVESVMNNII